VVSFALPRIVIAGLAANAGKTLVAAGLMRALRRRGRSVAPFKKGPDFIDPAWLGAAAGCPARSLDTFLMSGEQIASALASARGRQVAVIEGNRGLFDGVDAEGTHSTAELAKRLRAPLVLVVDVSKATRTVAALVLGCRALDPGLPLSGVILNRVGSARQEKLIREAIWHAAHVPVLGAIPRLPLEHLPSRHLGLVMPGERGDAEPALEALADAIEQYVDLDGLCFLADEAPRLPLPEPPTTRATSGERVRIGVLRDDAFCFCYPENLAGLEAAGGELVPISPLHDHALPAIDALYACGGYPEEHAEELAANTMFRAELAARIAEGLPVWAECGGLMYLASALHCRGRRHAMVGALPIEIEQTGRPQGHGYVEAVVDEANPFFSLGTRLRGHEFHYSRPTGDVTVPTVLALQPGTGMGGGRDGVVPGRVFASYLHVFAPATPAWAPTLVRLARDFRNTHDRVGSRRASLGANHRGRVWEPSQGSHQQQ
jgi:cobyrinic acid a,c-diamide synthase